MCLTKSLNTYATHLIFIASCFPSKIDVFPYDSRQLGAPGFGQKKHPLTQWSIEKQKNFHNVKIKIKRVSGYIIMSDHNKGVFLAAIPVRST